MKWEHDVSRFLVVQISPAARHLDLPYRGALVDSGCGGDGATSGDVRHRPESGPSRVKPKSCLDRRAGVCWYRLGLPGRRSPSPLPSSGSNRRSLSAAPRCHDVFSLLGDRHFWSNEPWS